MKSFRTELENSVVQNDILELEQKIYAYKNGQIDDDRFRSLRLARGVYGQRQDGVQMIRIKIPYGRLTTQQFLTICDVSDEYSRGKLHITTRQDIQIHYVSLDRTPELWAHLESQEVTLREACGNTVRNVTASHWAGVDTIEPFDVTPYADAFFLYFLRYPVCQDMGRKFKVAFSSSNRDDSYTFMHDLGLIPKIKIIDGKEVRGFKTKLAGGLGSQPNHAYTVHEFLPTDQLIPFAEAVLRVFDRYGERARRAKARIKFLVQDIGFDAFMKLVEEEQKAVKFLSVPIDGKIKTIPTLPEVKEIPTVNITDVQKYEDWKATCVFAQKQAGYNWIGVKISTGDIMTNTTRKLVDLIKNYAADDVRLTINQGLTIRYVTDALLPYFYQELDKLDLAEAGFESVLDITACPGTDTCNLGIASSTGLAQELERILKAEYPQLIHDKEIKIKISGCMNACGQHNLAHIGFQGMTVKSGKLVAPASQILLGGSGLEDGNGRFADKVLKVPSKRSPDVLRTILNDYAENSPKTEKFNAYYDRQGTNYFYDLLKHYSHTEDLPQEDFIDWGNDQAYVMAIGVGECAGVTIDLVATLLIEAEEAVRKAKKVLTTNAYADAIYHAYNGMIYAAKALLTSTKAKINTQASIVANFDLEYVETKKVTLESTFSDAVYQINKNNPTKEFAEKYIANANKIVQILVKQRNEEIAG